MFLIALLIMAKMDNKPNIHQHQNGLKNYGTSKIYKWYIIYIMQCNNNVNNLCFTNSMNDKMVSEYLKTQKYIFIEIYLYRKKFLLKYIHVLRPQNCTLHP